MKQCPYCLKELPDDLVTCIYCQRNTQKSAKVKWYFNTGFIIFLFLSAGPFALPLVWMHPRYSVKTKIIITSIVIAATLIMVKLLLTAMQSIGSAYEQLLL